jgi:hypothetical protein
MTLPAFRPQWLDSSEREHMFNQHPVRSKQVPLMALAIVYRHPSAKSEAIDILEHPGDIVGQPNTLLGVPLAVVLGHDRNHERRPGTQASHLQ